MNKSSGFTLIEALVVIALVAILTALAAPSFKNLIQSNSISSSVNSFLADMRFARSEAIRRGSSVVICRSTSPETSPACNGTYGQHNDWKTGWIIFDDLNKDGNLDSGEPVLRVQGPITNIDSIDASSKYQFKFNATGRLPGYFDGIKFGGSNFPTTNQRVVCVSAGGRTRIAGDGSTSCPTN
jgi:type IV fimbrial biogenesis protein FimT